MADMENLPSYHFARALLSSIPVWAEDKEFKKVLSQVTFSLAPRPRCYLLYQLSQQARNISGDVAEIGVYKGGTARILSDVFSGTDKTVYLFDTFEGMPETDASKDRHKKGDFADTSVDAVRAQLAGLNNYRLVPGLFPETASVVNDKQFCLVHIDVDIYQSVMDCCKFFYSRMSPGGFMVFDDYGSESCPGARLAVDEFFGNKKETPVYSPSGQVFVVKLC
jgi:O-methyltransferase